ncbi:MAG: hypothetical protein B7X08_01295 [Acidocella sp. 20-63-7]|nr:MAG: hypothetical protein B7X08_01295 [Acidocella sp. 20-63-7]HQT45736.1 cell division protein FtsX [Acidocella sp.]
MTKRVDYLGLRFALTDRLLPVLVAAMSFLAALAIAGTLATTTLALQWQGDAASALTIQVPDPATPAASGGATRLAAVQAALQGTVGVANAQLMAADQVNRLLEPWLGADVAQLALPIPAIITANWQGAARPDGLAAALDKVAPGTLVQTGITWAARVAALTASLQTCAATVLLVVALVAGALVAVATRSGIAQRREAVEIIHGLGALDADIADSFAARATLLTFTGAVIGTLLALPILFWLATLAAPFSGVAARAALPSLPPALWVALPLLPLVAACIGWSTAQLTVRGWLRSLA